MRPAIVPLFSVVFIAACGGRADDPSTRLAENTESIQVRDDVPAENGLNPIATLSLDNGNALEFYEPFPGVGLISEVGRVPAPPLSSNLDLRSMSLVEIHQTVAPGQPVPAMLTAAQHRIDTLEAQDVTVAETDVEPFANHDDVAMNNDANQDDRTKDDDAISRPKSRRLCHPSWFRTRFCSGRGNGQCATNVRGNTTVKRYRLDHLDHTVCVDLGDVNWTVYVGNHLGKILLRDYPLGGNWDEYYRTYSGTRQPTQPKFFIESEVTRRSANPRYHVATYTQKVRPQ